MLRILAFIIVLGFFAWLVPKAMKPAPLPDQATMAAANNNGSGGLSAAEVSYYRQIFDYTMDNIQPGQGYAWKSFSANGTINVAANFVSKSGSTCRKFNENASVGAKVYTNEGYGCKRRGSDGWCKLHDDDALTCAMEKSWVGIDIPGVPVISMPHLPGVNANVNADIEGPNVNTDVDTSFDHRKAGGSYADTVTGAAGSAAGPITKGALGLYNDFFR